MLVPITLTLLILQSVHGELYCDGIEINIGGVTSAFGAGICYPEDDSSFYLVCNSESKLYSLQFENSFCDGEPSEYIDFGYYMQFVAGSQGGSFDITCCSGNPCPYSVETSMAADCPSTTTMYPYPMTTMDPETTDSGVSVQVNVDLVCQGQAGEGFYQYECTNNTLALLGYSAALGATDCEGIPSIVIETTSGECMDNTFYEIMCGEADDTCIGVTLPPLPTFPFPEFDTTEPYVIEPLATTCDALQYYGNDGQVIAPAGYCSTLGNETKVGSYYPICKSEKEMVIDYYSASNDCSGYAEEKTMDELMKMVNGVGTGSFVCCTREACPVVVAEEYYGLTDCSDDVSGLTAYPETDVVGVCEDDPPDSSGIITQCGPEIAIRKQYSGQLGCPEDGAAITFDVNITTGLCVNLGDSYLKVLVECGEAVDTCPTPSPTEETPAPTAAPEDDGTTGADAASQIMILLNIMVGIGMLMMN